MTHLRLTRDAERDLIDIYLRGVAHCGEYQAETYARALNDTLGMLVENPLSGSDYGFIRSGVRRMKKASHVFYDRPIREGILVLRVLHRRMDPGRHLA